MRRNKKWVKSCHGTGKIPDMVMITERPAEATDRALPGHWEGDLIMGKGFTSVDTLVERKTRYLKLVRLPKDHGAEAFRGALSKRIVTLPAQLRRSITSDQVPEMSEHVRFSVDTGVDVYFCDPTRPGRAEPARTPTGCSANTRPKGPICRSTTSDSPTPSSSHSTRDLERPSGS
jgi:IS30 family transposase